MSVSGDKRLNEQDKKRERQEQSKRGKRTVSAGVTADYTQADPALVVRAVCAWAARGGALRFGYTRDGGAYAIGIYGDGDPYTEYIPPSEDINAFLMQLVLEME